MYRNAYLLLILTTLFWGGNAIAGKLALGHVSPMTLTALRWFFAFLLLLAVGWPRLRADWQAVRAHLPLLVVLGALGFAVFNIAMYCALVFTTAINLRHTNYFLPRFGSDNPINLDSTSVPADGCTNQT